MIGQLITSVAGGVLLCAVLLKLSDPRASLPALATYGINRHAWRVPLWAALILSEATLGAAVLAGRRIAFWAAAALCLLFMVAIGAALAGGRRGDPCGCFGTASTVGVGALARAGALAATFVGLAVTDTTSGAGAVGAALAGVGVAVVGVVRARRAPVRRRRPARRGLQGPSFGERLALVEDFAERDRARFAVAIFRSSGCPACEAAAPAIADLAARPGVALEIFDAQTRRDAWRDARIPGSPYAVVLHPGSGRVLARGSFNGGAHLANILAAAERRALAGFGSR